MPWAAIILLRPVRSFTRGFYGLIHAAVTSHSSLSLLADVTLLNAEPPITRSAGQVLTHTILSHNISGNHAALNNYFSTKSFL
jgi:hypothetical protein